ncbi:DUF7674 family protein [Ensifer adhaerens]|uniref:DUF7674 family protein n=1 Tax=Ensifer adhaerens TaxID=106592 RepID=UPI000CF1B60D|nr:hypothetical protein [Ensifer adhaerens]
MPDNDSDARSFTIDRSNMFEPLLQADPSFAETWAAFQEEWRDDDEPPPLYLALAELARHLIRKLEAGDTPGFRAVFDVVERWHIHGDAYVKEAATVGLLEDLQNGNFHRVTSPDDFLPWLAPETLGWWIQIRQFWAGEPRIG